MEPAARREYDALRAEVPTNRQSRRQDLPEQIERARLSSPALQRVLGRDGRIQFGTLGRGNHFLELQEAVDDGALWIMIHSGSRGLGPTVRAHHLGRATWRARDIHGIQASGAEGEAYLADVGIAVSYADASRRRMLQRTADVLASVVGATLLTDSLISCVHNFVRCERHGSETLWVHRKGAASADVGESAVIPGSMGADSFHVVGRGHAEALRSSSHGAGRSMSRGEARRRISLERFRRETAGVWFADRGETLVDEAPSAYKPIRDVMRAQQELTKIVRRLRPIVVYKGV
jgi:tRNA-splicing ligase RtcB (3'-phosphate/5'-hydroxy nucleic acid ligase)